MRERTTIKKMLMDNLTYCRLQADVAAIETEIAENQPLSQTDEGGFWRKLYNKTRVTVHNGLRKLTADELEKEAYFAKAELKRFESEHTEKQLALAKNPAKLTEFIYKKIFKKDKYGLNKTSLALALIMDDRYAYQRPEQSLQVVSDILFADPAYMQGLYDALCENFKRVRGDVLPSVDGLISLIPSLGNAGLKSLLNRGKKKRFKASLEKLSTSQTGALFAAKLTSLQKAKAVMPMQAWEDLADDTLKVIQNVRADAEYKFVFDVVDGGVADEVCALCVHTVERLAELYVC